MPAGRDIFETVYIALPTASRSSHRRNPATTVSSYAVSVALSDDKLCSSHVVLFRIRVVDRSVKAGTALWIVAITVGLNLPGPVRTIKVGAWEAAVRGAGTDVVSWSWVCDPRLVTIHNCSDDYRSVSRR